MEEKERIIGMLSSGEEGLMRLGAIMALGMGPEWCVETFTHLQTTAQGNIKKRHKWPVITNIPGNLIGWKYVKDGMCVYFGGYVEVDYWYRITPAMNMYKTIDLDNHET